MFWIGTYDGGLSRFKDGRFFNFNTENGLFSNGVFATVEDERGNFWMSSNKGIYRVNKTRSTILPTGKLTITNRLLTANRTECFRPNATADDSLRR